MRIWIHHWRWFATLLFIAGFVAGAVCTSWQPAAAQQRFDREDLKSVPKSFLEGGDRVLPVLKEIAQSSKASANSLARIEARSGDADKRHRDLMKKVDQLDERLEQLNKTMLKTTGSASPSAARSAPSASRSNLPDR